MPELPPVPPVPPTQAHSPLLADPNQPILVATGTMSLLLGFAKIIAGLTTERALILFICVGAGWMFYTRERSQAEDKAQIARAAEEAKERDRRHCDDREEKSRRDMQAEAEKMRTWYISMSDGQRRFEAEQRDKDRAAVAELAKAIARKIGESDLP